MTNRPIKTAIVLPDLHIPYHDKKSLASLEKFMADNRWDYYINLGDMMDFDCISHHNKNKLREVEGKRILKDYEEGNKILDRHQKIIRKRNPNAKFILLEGNHDYRIQRYLDANPQMEGMIEMEVGLRLKERGFKYIQCYTKGEVFKLGKAMFHHGLYTTKYHANKMVDTFGDNIFFGHTHDCQTFSRSTYGEDKTTVGQSLGCLCDYNQSYMKGRPSKWQQAFGVFYFMPSGFFNYYVPMIFNGQFMFNNKLYK